MSSVARKLFGLAALCVALGALALSAAPTVAAPAPRSYLSQMTGFVKPEAVTIGANDEVWTSDPGKSSVINRYSAFPALTKLGSQDGGGLWGGGLQVLGMSVSTSNGFLYAPFTSCGSPHIPIFDNFNNLYSNSLQTSPSGGVCEIWSAVDNSDSDSRGRVYIYQGQYNQNPLQAYDGYGNPVNFTGSAPYIVGNTITGTPYGPFSGESAGSFDPVFAGITVDSHGNIWVTDAQKGELDEFAPSGLFIKRITAESSGVPPGSNPSGPTTFGSSGYGGYVGFGGIAVDPTNGDILVSDRDTFVVDEFSPQGEYIGQLTGDDTPAGGFNYNCYSPYGPPGWCYDGVVGIAVDSRGYLYVSDAGNKVIDIFSPRPVEPKVSYGSVTNPTSTSGTLNATVDPNGGGDITSCHIDYVDDAGYDTQSTTPYASGSSTACTPDPGGSAFSSPTDVHAELSGLNPETTYHYAVVVGNDNATRVGDDQLYTPHQVIGLRADPATDVTSVAATLNGSFVGDGTETHYYFEWGTTTSYGNQSATPPGAGAGSPSGPSRTTKSFDISNLSPVTRYHYRIVAVNSAGTSYSDDQSFRTSALLPQVQDSVSNVHSNGVLFQTQINPGGADTSYHFEYGTSDCSTNSCSSTPTPDAHIGSNLVNDYGTKLFEGLKPGTTYYYRVVATNSAGTIASPSKTFATQPFDADLSDACPNTLGRQQTGAALLLDCRAYELVSASPAGGYDVESDLVPGQTPFTGYPRAENPSQVLYGVHNGAIPGPWNPTNRGVDPYVATRGENGWSTKYVGIPANAPSTEPFSSTVQGADAGLDSFAFAGASVCSPCFGDGSTGVPIHLPDGNLVQGMAGSLPVAQPLSAGVVKKPFSDNGSHFVFGSEQQFEPTANPGNGNVTIYVRDLESGSTEVASTGTTGTALADGSNIAELDLSGDGSRVLIGDLIGTDSDGNHRWHLYMHVAGDPDSIDLTPGATDGVLYDGMTSDGSKVFFTTAAALSTGSDQDTDTSADIYEADASGSGATLTRVSTGDGAGNTDSCNPAGGWNSISGGAKCDAVAIGGAGGVATGDGTVYFLSPEVLDSSASAQPVQDQPNLYVARPGEDPRFVATIDSNLSKPLITSPTVADAVHRAEVRVTSDFQVSPSGDFAAFPSDLRLVPSVDNVGHSEVYRYDADTQDLECTSCNPTHAEAVGDASMATNGLSLTDDGRVFFDTTDVLALRDGDNRKDVYEWEKPGTGNCVSSDEDTNYYQFTDACVSLVSAGTSPFDSSLLSASADGTDAYFFTHDTLARQDGNGPVTKIYDARANGGFFDVPPPALCAASDECHGPGTQAPGAPQIGTVAGTPRNTPAANQKTKKYKHHHRKHHHRTHRRHHRHG